MKFISKDKKTIRLPVPLGTTVYRVHTDCNDACTFQRQKFTEVFPTQDGGRCNKNMPCHTRIHSIQPKELSLSNLHWVLAEWGTWFFATEEEAREAGNKIIELHKKQLVELGLKA